ncbi:phosphoribosylanthranilate isomerase [Sandaracinomonas limnophila]|uniref:N-(5'-phosphoribosyl)anthranilate isomerase n=1 Tax=Sandaracinomonas limnophila TaxID=1862386 RepID=A0A437PPA1_9BACT|nr:phosphoribosylanthranilate isomerase [Sandaracinomonas limnophila]RVU24123.1 phosphoribosylanthranilate isomerase [Sandaracinomonas limnophila]
MTHVKICCISSPEEAQIAIKNGASALGLVGNMPSGPGIIEDSLIHQIAKTVPPPIATFLLTSETEASAIVSHYQKVHTTTIQIVDALEGREYTAIRNALPHVKLVQVIHVIDEASVQEAIEVSEFVDAILLDSGNPNLATKELGGTGRVHNWDLSRKIRESISIPLFLAGGLNKDNVRQAIDAVQPFGIDLCSGVRTNGILDERKLQEFFEAIAR